MLSAKYGVLMGCRTIADIRVRGAVEWDGEEFACGVKVGMDGSGEALWGCLLLNFRLCLGECVLWLVGGIFV